MTAVPLTLTMGVNPNHIGGLRAPTAEKKCWSLRQKKWLSTWLATPSVLIAKNGKKMKNKITIQNRPSVKINGRWYHTAKAAAEQYSCYSVAMWKRRLRAVPSPDFVTAYWRRRDRVEELAYKVFKKYLP
jgi:hypothetical protein